MKNWTVLLGVVLWIHASAAGAASDVLYKMTFDPSEQAATWELHGDAGVTDTGRTGKSLHITTWGKDAACLLYTSDAADE